MFLLQVGDGFCHTAFQLSAFLIQDILPGALRLGEHRFQVQGPDFGGFGGVAQSVELFVMLPADAGEVGDVLVLQLFPGGGEFRLQLCGQGILGGGELLQLGQEGKFGLLGIVLLPGQGFGVFLLQVGDGFCHTAFQFQTLLVQGFIPDALLLVQLALQEQGVCFGGFCGTAQKIELFGSGGGAFQGLLQCLLQLGNGVAGGGMLLPGGHKLIEDLHLGLAVAGDGLGVFLIQGGKGGLVLPGHGIEKGLILLAELLILLGEGALHFFQLLLVFRAQSVVLLTELLVLVGEGTLHLLPVRAEGFVLCGQRGELLFELPQILLQFGVLRPDGRGGLGSGGFLLRRRGGLGIGGTDGQQHLAEEGKGLQRVPLLAFCFGRAPVGVCRQGLKGQGRLQQFRDRGAEFFPEDRYALADGEAVVFFLQLLQRGDGAPIGHAVDPLDEGLADETAGDVAVALLVGQGLFSGEQELHQGLALPPGEAVPIGQAGEQLLADLEILGLLGRQLQVQGLVQVEIQILLIRGAAACVGMEQEDADGGGADQVLQLAGVLENGKTGLDGQRRGQEGIDLAQKLHGAGVEGTVLLQLQHDGALFQQCGGGQLHQKGVLLQIGGGDPGGGLFIVQGMKGGVVRRSGEGEAGTEEVAQIVEFTGLQQRGGLEEIGVLTQTAAAVGAGGAQRQEGHHVPGPAGTLRQRHRAVAHDHGMVRGGLITAVGQHFLNHAVGGLQIHDAQLAQEGAQVFGTAQLPGGLAVSEKFAKSAVTFHTNTSNHVMGCRAGKHGGLVCL